MSGHHKSQRISRRGETARLPWRSRTHGQKHSEREPGSIGATAPQRVFKGTSMAGRMGGKQINVKNLKIIKVDKDKNELWISGAMPGRRGTFWKLKDNPHYGS